MNTMVMVFLVVGLMGVSITAQAAEYFLDQFDDTDPPGGWELPYTSPGLSKIDTKIGVVGGTRYTGMPGIEGMVGYTPLELYPGEQEPGHIGSLGTHWDSDQARSFFVLYDANDAGLNLDFTPVTTLTIGLWVDHYGVGRPTFFQLTLTDESGKSFISTKTYSSPQTFNDWLEETFPISSFSGSADLAHIKSFRFDYAGDCGQTVLFDSIKADASPAPLPGSVALHGTGLLGLAAAGWRRKRKS